MRTEVAGSSINSRRRHTRASTISLDETRHDSLERLTCFSVLDVENMHCSVHR